MERVTHGSGCPNSTRTPCDPWHTLHTALNHLSPQQDPTSLQRQVEQVLGPPLRRYASAMYHIGSEKTRQEVGQGHGNTILGFQQEAATARTAFLNDVCRFVTLLNSGSSPDAPDREEEGK